MTDEMLLKRLQRPEKYPLDVVLDTDTYNEVDDQYALVYMLRNRDKLNVKAINAAPFSNIKSPDPKTGMRLSLKEIFNVLDLIKEDRCHDIIYKGSEAYLSDEKTFVDSPAARNIVNLANGRSAKDAPLYLIAIGAITNVASAILMDPSIIDKIVIVWLGGHAHNWPDNKEFNLHQDVAAARVVFGCRAPVVQLPCMGVVSAFTTTGPELEYWLKDKNDFCNYIIRYTRKEAELFKQGKCWSRALWDVTAIAWLLSDEFQRDCFAHSPICEYDGKYAFDDTRHMIRYVYHINRDKLIADLFEKISQ